MTILSFECVLCLISYVCPSATYGVKQNIDIEVGMRKGRKESLTNGYHAQYMAGVRCAYLSFTFECFIFRSYIFSLN